MQYWNSEKEAVWLAENSRPATGSDLVKRLRGRIPPYYCGPTMREAADEVERLVFERDQHRDAANAYKEEAERLRVLTDRLADALRRATHDRPTVYSDGTWVSMLAALNAYEIERLREARRG